MPNSYAFLFWQEYRPNTRPDVGVGSLPDGRDYYRHALSYHLTDPKATAEEIHAMGVAEVHRIAEEMDEVRYRLSDFPEIFLRVLVK